MSERNPGGPGENKSRSEPVSAASAAANFLERMRQLPSFQASEAAYEHEQQTHVKTNQELLVEAYDNGDTDTVQDLIDTEAMRLMQADARFMNPREHPLVPRDEIKKNNLALKEEYKTFVANIAGLPEELAIDDIMDAKRRTHEYLESKGFTFDDPKEALRLLGILSTDENGDEKFDFPTELVPELVTEKWGTYLAIVIDHVQSTADLLAGKVSQADVKAADDIRTAAHGSVTRDVHEILGLQGMQGWELKTTRALLAKMRDQLFPDQDSTLSPMAKQIAAEFKRGVDISKSLAAPHT